MYGISQEISSQIYCSKSLMCNMASFKLPFNEAIESAVCLYYVCLRMCYFLLDFLIVIRIDSRSFYPIIST